MTSKGNVLYFIASLATVTLSASSIFAVAPYVGFLAPVAALNIGLPFIVSCAVFSAVVIALSCIFIKKNNAIHGNSVVLDKKTKKLVSPQNQIETIRNKDTEISSMEEQLAKEAKIYDENTTDVEFINRSAEELVEVRIQTDKDEGLSLDKNANENFKHFQENKNSQAEENQVKRPRKKWHIQNHDNRTVVDINLT